MSAEAQAPEQEAALVESGSLLDSILNETRLKPSDEGFDVAKRGVEAFISELLSSSNTEKVDQSLVDLMISEIDQKLSNQVDAILHSEEVQAGEAIPAIEPEEEELVVSEWPDPAKSGG